MDGKAEADSTPDRPRLSDLASATPDTRDRYVDFLRALSVVVVISGHWLGAVIEWRDDGLKASSALDLIPGLWIITWLLQIMPIFFFVGGFSNMVTFEGLQRLGEGKWAFVRGRANRLLRPAGIFLLFWAIAGTLIVRLANVSPQAQAQAQVVLLGPLWFLTAYFVLVTLTPFTVALHRRFGVRALIALGLIPVIIDVVRFVVGVPEIGWANFVFVWLFVHQLGYFYADGTFNRMPRRFFWAVAVGGFATMIALAQLEAYPASMVGCCSDKISNMNPPTLAIMALGIGQVGLAMLLRSALTRWLSNPKPWKAVIAFNATIMTFYLWHLSALVITVGILLPLGFPQPELGSGIWWLTRPLWYGAMILVLGALVFVWGRFERPDLDPAERYWNLKEFYAL